MSLVVQAVDIYRNYSAAAVLSRSQYDVIMNMVM